MRDTWQHRIQRAEHLAADGSASVPLVTFYAALLSVQEDLYNQLNALSNWRPSGALDHDLPVFQRQLPAVLRAIASVAPLLLEAEGGRLDQMLLAFWRAPSDRQFFAKAILQPYAQWLAERGIA